MVIMYVMPAQVEAEPIPAGCPGSTMAGPAAPGFCESIPAGCPGSTLAGPAFDPDACPYEAPSSGQSYGDFSGDCTGTDISQDCGIVNYLKLFINVLSGIVGVVIVIMITVGGIQYSTARDNPQAAAAAKGRITNAVMALVFYLFIFAFLQYIVPGGVL